MESFSSQSMFIASVIYAALAVGLFGWAIYEHGTSRFLRPLPAWRVMTLKLTLFIGLHVLPVAVFFALLSPLYCPVGGAWMNEPSIICGSTAASAMAAGGVIIAVPLLATHVVVAATAINRVPDPEGKRNRLSSPHGRVQTALIFLRFVRICFAAVGGSSLSPALQTGLDVVLGLVWLGAYLRFLPYRVQVRLWWGRITCLRCHRAR